MAGHMPNAKPHKSTVQIQGPASLGYLLALRLVDLHNEGSESVLQTELRHTHAWGH
jgi:hypothetical protein